jgi:hypothetical protein
MPESVTVWIVEDNEGDAHDAWNVITRVSAVFESEATIYWSDNFAWDTTAALRSAINRSLPSNAHSDYPDLVVMDLCLNTAKGEELYADGFYKKLRDFETHKSDGKPAFVVFWSIHQGRRDTDQFVGRSVDSDARIITLGSKRPELLMQKLTNLWRRVLDEREERNG